MIREKTARFRKPVTMRFLGGKARYSLIFSLLQGHISAQSKCYNIITIKGEETSTERSKIKGGGQPPEGEFFMKNANSNNHKIDYVKKTITFSKSFYEKACNINNAAEFEEVKKLRTEFPDFKFTVKQIKKKVGKKTYRNLTYKNMEIYIRANEENRDTVLLKFESIKAKSCIQPSPYAYVKKWFLEQYPDYTENMQEMETDNAISIVEETEGSAA